MSLEKFLAASEKVLQSQDVSTVEPGYKRVRGADVGFFHKPGASKAATEARIYQTYDNTPLGQELWEAEMARVNEQIEANAIDLNKDVPKVRVVKTKKPFTLNIERK